METEDLLASTVMGFLLGLAAFVGSYVRVRQWSAFRARGSSSPQGSPDDRHVAIHPKAPPLISVRDLATHLFTLDRWADLVGVGFILAMLVYGAIVAPRVRYILFVAVVTVTVTWWVFRCVMRWLHRGQVS